MKKNDYTKPCCGTKMLRVFVQLRDETESGSPDFGNIPILLLHSPVLVVLKKFGIIAGINSFMDMYIKKGTVFMDNRRNFNGVHIKSGTTAVTITFLGDTMFLNI